MKRKRICTIAAPKQAHTLPAELTVTAIAVNQNRKLVLRTYKQATEFLITNRIQKLKTENKFLKQQLQRATSDNSKLIDLLKTGCKEKG